MPPAPTCQHNKATEPHPPREGLKAHKPTTIPSRSGLTTKGSIYLERNTTRNQGATATRSEKSQTGHRVLPSTEEELQQHLERKAKREHYRQLATAEAEANIQEHERQAQAARLALNAGVVATFAKRARDAAISVGATPKAAEAAASTAAADAETTIADARAMQE